MKSVCMILAGRAYLSVPAKRGIGRGEPVRDTARVLERYVDAIMIRTYSQDVVEELPNVGPCPPLSTVPSDLYHPCRIPRRSFFTIQEYKGAFRDKKIVYIGDGNNVANSWIEAAILLGLNFSLATPEGYEPEKTLFAKARKNKTFFYSSDPFEAVQELMSSIRTCG